MLSGGLDRLSGSLAIGLLWVYFGQAFSPCYSSIWTSIFSLFHLLLSGDGSADGRRFQRQRLWPQWVSSHFMSCWRSHRLIFKLCKWELVFLLVLGQSLHLSLLFRLLYWNSAERYRRVQGQQHRLDERLFSAKYRWYTDVYLTDRGSFWISYCLQSKVTQGSHVS